MPSVTTTLGFELVRVVRVVRVLSFYRFTRDGEFFFGTVSGETLRVAKLLLTVLTIVFLYAGLFFSFERRTNPGIATFGDIFYFSVVSLTTVDFGDIKPTTSAGRSVTVAVILVGVVVIPWQGSGIVREWATRDKVDVTCSQCGLSAHDPDASHCKAYGHVIYQEFDPTV